jgi:hypothetical protein
VSRLDAAAKREYIVLANSGTSKATIQIQTATPQSRWNVLFGAAAPPTTGPLAKMTVTVPAVSAVLLQASAQIGVSPVSKVKLQVGADSLSNLFVAKAKIPGRQPLSVAFAYRRLGTAKWKRLDVDDSPPYRAFLDPAQFKKHERLQLVAIARSLDGSTTISKVVGFRLPGR